MKGAVIESPGKIIVKDIPDPVINDYDVLCNTLAVSVCSGTDNHILDNHPYYNIKFPVILGHEGIGEVIECGSKVRNLKEGDIITRTKNRLPENCGYTLLHGAFSERGIATDWLAMKEDGISSDKWEAHTVNRVLPPACDSVGATMIITWRETFSFLKKMKHKPNDFILIIGSGATAVSFANHATNLDLHTVVLGNKERSDIFSRVGVDNVISYRNPDYKDLIKKLWPKFNIIIDTVGDSQTLAGVLCFLKNKGKVGVYGLNSYPDYYFSFAEAPEAFSFYNGEYYDEGSAHNDIMNFYNDGKLNPWNYLSKDHIYSLENIKDALLACRRRDALKSVVNFNQT